MKTLDHGRLARLVSTIFEAAGSSEREARAVADHLVDSNLVGHDSHGVIRVKSYLEWIADGRVAPNQHAGIVRDRGSFVIIEGNFGFGQVVAREAMEIGIERCRTHGTCSIALRNAGHIGRVGAWAEMVAEQGLVSLHFVNTSGFALLVAPFGGIDRRLSANPIAAGFPVTGREPIIVDVATATVAEGKIMVAINKGEQLPDGAIIDGYGRPTRDPHAFYGDPPGAILPFGGHKGSALSVMCEIFAGALTGGGTTNPKSPTAWRLVNNMFSLLIDPALLEDGFDADVEQFSQWVLSARPVDPVRPVMLPGDVERATLEHRLSNGIPLDEATIAALNVAAESFGLQGKL